MNFKIISVGWDCSDVLEQTLRSVESQTYPHWKMHIVDDASGPRQQEMIANWCDSRDERWSYELRTENRGAVANHYEGVLAMNPEDEDVIVYLDLDGDQLADPGVLERLTHYYGNGALVTYGDYRPIPDPGGETPVHPFPEWVVLNNAYRMYVLNEGVCFNHLRTTKWKVLKRIPKSYFQWADGTWLRSGSDYIVMTGCLEIAGGRYRCIKGDTLLLYNAQQPHPDNVFQPEITHQCDVYAMGMPPLPREF